MQSAVNYKAKRSHRGAFGKAMLYICLSIAAILILIPLCWALMNSFKYKKEFADNVPWAFPRQFYIQNYYNAWVEAHMGKYFLNTIIVTILSMVMLLVLTIPCTYVLARFKFHGVGFLQMLMLAGIFINVNYIVVPINSMVNNFGASIGIDNLTDNLFVVSLVYAATSLPYSIYLLGGFFGGLAKDFEEAAQIDGCGYTTTLIRILIPLLTPSIVIIILFNFMKFWNEYLIAVTFLTTESKRTLALGLINLNEVEKLGGDKGRLFAGLTIVMLPTLVMFIALQKQLTQGITMGGVKA